MGCFLFDMRPNFENEINIGAIVDIRPVTPNIKIIRREVHLGVVGRIGQMVVIYRPPFPVLRLGIDQVLREEGRMRIHVEDPAGTILTRDEMVTYNRAVITDLAQNG